MPGVLPPGLLILGKYKVVSLIAEGGFARVYKVRHMLMKKEFALKALNTVDASDSTRRRMKMEAEATSRLDHPNLVKAFDFDFLDDMPFIIFELVDGPTLAEHLKSRVRLPLSEALDIFLPVCYGLAYAHDLGVIHRDLKPGNIMLARDEIDPSRFIPKVVDFGIAKTMLGDAGESLTKTGDKFGTPLYMSPEQCSAAGADERSDIYSLGCVLFESLTGTPPFKGTTALETMMQHVNSPTPSLKEASLGGEFPAAIEKIVAKMLAKDSRERYQNFMAVGQDLLLSQQGEGERIQVVAMRPQRGAQLRRSRNVDWLSVGIALITGLVVGSLVLRLAAMKLEPNGDVGKAVDKIASPAKQTPAEVSADPPGWNFTAPMFDCGYFRQDRDVNSPDMAFNFPLPPFDLGQLFWWQGRRMMMVPASGNQSIPKQAHFTLTLQCSPDLYQSPFYLAHFRSHDLAGIIAEHGQKGQTFDESDFAILSMTKQQELALLSLDNWDCSPGTFEQLKRLVGLRVLHLKNMKLYAPDQPRIWRRLSGDQICTLPLAVLRELVIDHVDDIHTAMKCLKHLTYLKRLAIQDSVSLTDEGLAGIAAMRPLDTLDIRSSLLHGAGGVAMDCLAVLPNLRRLAMDYPYLSRHRPTKRLKHLEELVLCGTHSQSKELFAKELKAALPPQFDVKRNLHLEPESTSKDADAWFDPLKRNPYLF
jgi:serine/threonine protein kinase